MLPCLDDTSIINWWNGISTIFPDYLSVCVFFTIRYKTLDFYEPHTITWKVYLMKEKQHIIYILNHAIETRGLVQMQLLSTHTQKSSEGNGRRQRSKVNEDDCSKDLDVKCICDVTLVVLVAPLHVSYHPSKWATSTGQWVFRWGSSTKRNCREKTMLMLCTCVVYLDFCDWYWSYGFVLNTPLRGLDSRSVFGSEHWNLSWSSFFWKLIMELSIASFWISVGGMTMLQSMKSDTASVSARGLFAWNAAWLKTWMWRR